MSQKPVHPFLKQNTNLKKVDYEDMRAKSKQQAYAIQLGMKSKIREMYEKELEKAKARMQMMGNPI